MYGLFLLIFLLALLPNGMVERYYYQIISKIMIYSIFALSLQILVGFNGLVSLGHAMFFGVAGYGVALLMPYSNNGYWHILAAILLPMVLSLLVGALSLRTRGIYFIMVTLAFGQCIYYIFHDNSFAGGSDGAYLSAKSDFNLQIWADYWQIQLQKPQQFAMFVLGFLTIIYWFTRQLVRSQFGIIIQSAMINETRMSALGYNVFRYQMASFVLSAGIAGLAGYLYALQFGYISPAILSWHQSGNALLMIILGGIGSLNGAIFGAMLLILAQEFLEITTENWQLWLGIFMVLMVAFFPKGIQGIFTKFK